RVLELNNEIGLRGNQSARRRLGLNLRRAGQKGQTGQEGGDAHSETPVGDHVGVDYCCDGEYPNTRRTVSRFLPRADAQEVPRMGLSLAVTADLHWGHRRGDPETRLL